MLRKKHSLFFLFLYYFSNVSFAQSKLTVLSENEKQYQVHCSSNPTSYIDSAINGVVIYEPTLERFVLVQANYFFRFNVFFDQNLYSFSDPYEDNYIRFSKVSTVIEDINYKPTKYKNHRRFDLDDKFGEAKWIIPEALSKEDLAQGQHFNFNAHLILSWINDHAGGTSHMQCVASHLKDNEQKAANSRKLAESYWSVFSGIYGSRAQQMYQWLDNSKELPVHRDQRLRYKSTPYLKYTSNSVGIKHITCSENIYSNKTLYNCKINAPKQYNERERSFQRIYEESDSAVTEIPSSSSWEYHKKVKSLYNDFMECTYRFKEDKNDSYSCILK